MTDGLRMTVAGAVIGLLLAMGLSGLMSAQLYEIQGIDLGVYVGVTALLLFVGAGTSFLPAIRATRVDPVTALRPD